MALGDFEAGRRLSVSERTTDGHERAPPRHGQGFLRSRSCGSARGRGLAAPGGATAQLGSSAIFGLSVGRGPRSREQLGGLQILH